jgi:hypothetical protein
MVAHVKEQDAAGDLTVSLRALRGPRAWNLSHGQGMDKPYKNSLNTRGMH